MGKLVTWLIVLAAVVYLAQPQCAKAEKSTEIIASTEYAENDTNDEAIILFIIIVVIIIGAIVNACNEKNV